MARRRSRRALHGAVALLTASLLLAAGPVSAIAWEKLSDERGVVIERRVVPGSTLPEIRATARSPLPPSVIAETIWNYHEYPQFIPNLKRLDILSDTGDDRLTYEQVSVPLLSDRDYTVRVRKRADTAAQRYEISFQTENDTGPPPDRRHVRVAHIRGKWTVEPAADGAGSLVRYQVQAEGGGSIPNWIAGRVQRTAAPDLVRAMLDRASVKTGKK
jgi:ribosome-associated toxin RatA of RatAB toxin-antitoxin module